MYKIVQGTSICFCFASFIFWISGIVFPWKFASSSLRWITRNMRETINCFWSVSCIWFEISAAQVGERTQKVIVLLETFNQRLACRTRRSVDISSVNAAEAAQWIAQATATWHQTSWWGMFKDCRSRAVSLALLPFSRSLGSKQSEVKLKSQRKWIYSVVQYLKPKNALMSFKSSFFAFSSGDPLDLAFALALALAFPAGCESVSFTASSAAEVSSIAPRAFAAFLPETWPLARVLVPPL